MSSSSSPSLSREEQEELARSNKKVKNVNHAGFSDSSDSRPSSPTHLQGMWSGTTSFKDKVVGEIPGAYTQAFNFGDIMEDDEESDEEVEALREGLVAVKFPRELKQKIRVPWARALIVKVYGRSIGFNYIQTRLLALWKPAGRLDCVDLGYGFFLTRLTLKEDFEKVLQKGPWFIGEHFLSIRPWEPDFKPEVANVSSIAVWIRLNGLPIEYYNAEALHLIGKAIGNVLRVDTHTASEARGRFTRLCVQVDVNKPLVTTIKIGKLEQAVCYEGIQKLCFDCGRMGHKRESCPYSIRQDVPPKKTVETESEKDKARSCFSREENADKADEEASGIVPDIVQDVGENYVQDSTYGPWIVVQRKVNGAKNKNPIMGPQAHRYVGNVQWTKEGYARSESAGPSRDSKRKMSPHKVRSRAQGECGVTAVEGCKDLMGLIFSSASPKSDEYGKRGLKVEKPKALIKTSPQASVKGKKALARSRPISTGAEIREEPSGSQAANKLLPTRGPRSEANKGNSVQGVEANAQAACDVNAKQDGGSSKLRSDRGQYASGMGMELGLAAEMESMEDDVLAGQSRCEEGSMPNGGFRVEGIAPSVLGRPNGCDGSNFSYEESFEAIGMGPEGDGKAPMSY